MHRAIVRFPGLSRPAAPDIPRRGWPDGNGLPRTARPSRPHSKVPFLKGW